MKYVIPGYLIPCGYFSSSWFLVFGEFLKKSYKNKIYISLGLSNVPKGIQKQNTYAICCLVHYFKEPAIIFCHNSSFIFGRRRY